MKKRNLLYYGIFLVSFFSLFYVYNVKSLLLPFIFLVLILFTAGLNLKDAVFFTFLFALPFEKAIRQWFFLITPTLVNGVPGSGFSLYFPFNPKICLGALLLFLYLAPKNKIDFRKTGLSLPTVSLLLFFLVAAVNTLFFPTRPVLNFIGLIQLWLPVWYFFSSLTNFTDKKSRGIFKIFIACLIIFSVSFGLLQFLRQHPLGKFIELTPSTSLSGYTTTDGDKQYRLQGFISHPVYFGSFMSMLLPLYLGIILTKKKERNSISFTKIILFLLMIIVIFGTLSRSAWINCLLVLSAFFVYQKKQTAYFINLTAIFRQYRAYIALLSMITLVLLSSFLIIRLKSFDQLFRETGNATIRIGLIGQSFKIISANPLLGTGLNNFTNELVKLDLPQNLLGFVVIVHNTILIFASELGLPAAILFIIFVTSVLFPAKNPFRQKPFIFACWISALTFLISSQFHPLFNQDPSFQFFMVIMGFIFAWKTLTT